MSIIRSLVTKLSFKVDRSGLDNFEKSIIGFKTKFALTSAAIGAAVSKTLDYFSGFAEAIRDTDSLSKRLRLATGEFIALRTAAQDFGLNPNQFEGYFERLNALLREGKSGFGEIFEIARKSRYELNLKPFADTGDVKGAFTAVLDYVKSLENLEDQANVIRDIFKESNPDGLIRLVSKGSEVFLASAESNRAYGDSQAALVQKSEQYIKSTQSFYRQLESLNLSFVENVLPLVTKGVEFLDKGIRGLSGLVSMARENVTGALDTAGRSVADFAYDTVGNYLLGTESLSSIQRKAAEDDYEFNKRLNQFYNPAGASPPVNIETNIEVNVPPGTSQDMATNTAEVVREAIERVFDEKTREIISNNPQVEQWS